MLILLVQLALWLGRRYFAEKPLPRLSPLKRKRPDK